MDQLVVLQEIFESFSAGGRTLSEIKPRSIEGICSDQVGKLLESAKEGRIDEDLCSGLADSLSDVYELKRMGDICRKAGLYAHAVKCYNKALSITGDQSIRPVLLNNLGQAYSRQADPGRAAVYYQNAAEGFEEIGDKSGLAHVLGNLGASYRRSRDWDKAIEHCYRGLKAFEEIGDEFGQAQMTGSLGRIYAEMGDIELAERYFERSMKEFQRLGDKKSAARIMDRMGRISAQSRNWSEAVRYYNNSIAIFNELGLDRSSGIVLSNLGRMYLEKGDAVSARDALDKALKLIRKDMQPAYQNAVVSMAACCSIIAKSHLEKAKSIGFQPLPVMRNSQAINDEDIQLASQYFARSSDRYQELSSFPKTDIPQIKVAASMARSLTYFSKLQAIQSEREAASLSERAISSLDKAVANSEGLEKERTISLKRILTGMKELWSASMPEIEPWRITKSLSNAALYMMGGACNASEADSCLRDALFALSGSLEAEKRRGAPAEQLKAAASHLRRAEKRMNVEEHDESGFGAAQIGQAAMLIEGLISQEASQPATSQQSISDLLNYRAQREALLLIGWVLAKDVLSLADNTSQFLAWNEAFDLIEGSAGADIIIEPEIGATVADPELDVALMQFEEAFEKRIGISSRDSVAASDELWLIPVKSSIAKSFKASQMLVVPDRYIVKMPRFEKIEPIDLAAAVQSKTKESAAKGATIDGPREENDNLGFVKADGEPEFLGETGNDSIANARKELKACKEWVSGALGSIINAENALKVIRSLMIVVIVLLAIRVILYLI